MKKVKRTSGLFLAVILFFVNPYIVQAAQQELVTITKENFTVDTFNGVDAVYRPGSSDGSSPVYSCAAYIKKYYKEVYDVSLYNLFYNKAPKSYGGEKVIKVSEPRIGDIVACDTDHGTTHWAIVKELNGDGTVALIEQNWKWTQGGKTVTTKNRTVEVSDVRFYRLKDVDEAGITDK